ncbi:DUF3592 domain-containing protein [Microbulbifer sp. ALW1]|uniref:DUF3592 domain-containing protein n=1 Tax=Microbulbifer sp. (strain ALW1) TaxID=1516059 RepID=UPI001358EE82|nr:DUF3592 domain-containing protein [Microbulbifer sp. ALW1]
MKFITWQFKFFVCWFGIFFSCTVVAMATAHEAAIDAVLLLLIVLGLVMLATTGRDAFLSVASKDWPRTEFSVLDSGIQIQSSTEGARVFYKAYFELGYNVIGREYRLLHHHFNVPNHDSRSDANAYIEEVYNGKHGKHVYYMPGSPEKAYVSPGLKINHILAIFLV